MATTTAKVDVYERITEAITRQLDNGVVPWHKPWSETGLAGMPVSMSSGKHYRGANLWVLWAVSEEHGYCSPHWGTYKQITERGGQVRKGERGTHVMLWRPLPCRDHGVERCRACHSGAVARSFVVFNAEQADDLPSAMLAPPMLPEREHTPLEAADAIVSGYTARGPLVVFGGDRAAYSPTLDHVRMPNAEAFESGDAYYSTFFHELTHSTGHASRLARKDLLTFHAFGDESYSREELCAEMGAAFLSAVVGIDQATVPASASYIAHWLKVLKADKKLLAGAAADAQRAADLILGLANESEVAA